MFSAGSLTGSHAQQYLNRIIDPTVDLLFSIPYSVVQEFISSFSRNDNTLILIVPVVNRGFPISVLFDAIPRADGSITISFPLYNMLRRASHT